MCVSVFVCKCMALSYSGPVCIIMFYCYENCFVFMKVRARPVEIPRRLLNGSAAWIRACSCRLFPDIIDFFRELDIEIRIIRDFSCVRHPWCGTWCGPLGLSSCRSRKMTWSVSMLDGVWFTSCYCHNPVPYVYICYLIFVITLRMKEMPFACQSFHEPFENCRSQCHPFRMGPLSCVDLALYVLRLKYVRGLKVRSDV